MGEGGRKGGDRGGEKKERGGEREEKERVRRKKKEGNRGEKGPITQLKHEQGLSKEIQMTLNHMKKCST